MERNEIILLSKKYYGYHTLPKKLINNTVLQQYLHWNCHAGQSCLTEATDKILLELFFFFFNDCLFLPMLRSNHSKTYLLTLKTEMVKQFFSGLTHTKWLCFNSGHAVHPASQIDIKVVWRKPESDCSLLQMIQKCRHITLAILIVFKFEFGSLRQGSTQWPPEPLSL